MRVFFQAQESGDEIEKTKELSEAAQLQVLALASLEDVSCNHIFQSPGTAKEALEEVEKLLGFSAHLSGQLSCFSKPGKKSMQDLSA